MLEGGAVISTVGLDVGGGVGNGNVGLVVSTTTVHPKYAGGLPDVEHTVLLMKGNAELVLVPTVGYRVTLHPEKEERIPMTLSAELSSPPTLTIGPPKSPRHCPSDTE